MRHSSSNLQQATRGFTLIEMLLVLGLMVVLIGIAYPSLSRLQLEQQLKQGAELVRLQMKQARLHSLESGLEYQFRFETGGKRFIVVPAEYSAIQTQQAVNQQSGNSQPQAVYWKTLGQFETKIHFSTNSSDQGLPPQPLPKEFLTGFDKVEELSRVAWSAPLIFRADGSARDFSVEIEHDNGIYLTLSVRGITGGTNISQMLRRVRQ